MQITHKEAQRLIQFNVDGALITQQKHVLTSHLENCVECQKYADDIAAMESVLRPMLHRNWDRKPLPLSIAMLTAKGKTTPERLIVATRIAALSVVFLAFFFGAWSLTDPSRTTPTPLLPNVPFIPTPFTSTMTSAAETGFEDCALTSYVVEANDTLASIADRFSVPLDHILQINSMRNQSLVSGQALIIPTCNFTPTNPAIAHTTTFTPIHYPVMTTPDG